LREGLRWSDGSPLTSRDIAFTYRFVIDNKIAVQEPPVRPDVRDAGQRTLSEAEEPTFAPDMPRGSTSCPGIGALRRRACARSGRSGAPSMGMAPSRSPVAPGWVDVGNPYYWGGPSSTASITACTRTRKP
jgi:hypothetical protein